MEPIRCPMLLGYLFPCSLSCIVMNGSYFYQHTVQLLPFQFCMFSFSLAMLEALHSTLHCWVSWSLGQSAEFWTRLVQLAQIKGLHAFFYSHLNCFRPLPPMHSLSSRLLWRLRSCVWAYWQRLLPVSLNLVCNFNPLFNIICNL